MARLVPLPAALLMAAALAACGGSAPVVRTTTTTHGKENVQPFVKIYSGLPLHGPMAKQGRAVLAGINLACQNANAYAHAHPGDVLIRCESLDDSGQKSGDGDLALTARHARTVATDPRAVYYIGDLSSAATAVSLAVLNAAGIAQVTPGDPYISVPKPQAGAPAPSPKLLRLLPTYRVQAAADMLFFEKIPPNFQEPACTRVVALAEADQESASLVKAMVTDAKSDGVQLLAPPTLPTKAATVSAYEVTFHGLAPCGFVIAGSASKPAVTVTKLLRSVFPRASVVGTSGLCEPDSKWTKAVGVSPIVDQLLWCTSPVLPLNDYMGSDSFAKLYKNVHGVSDPSPYALYGYEAADLGIGMVDYLEAEGDRVVGRDAVRTDLFDTSIREAVLGQFGLLANDDSSLSSYGLYHVTPADAEPSYYLTLKP